MINKPARKNLRKIRPSAADIKMNDEAELALIQTSMRKWESMDAAGRLAGRGLGKRELLERVVLEVGKSLRQVQDALRKNKP
jgi:hypothetical protein